MSNDLTDAELPGYLTIHTETPVGLVHKKHWARFLDLAQRTDDAKRVREGSREWYQPCPHTVKELCKNIPAET